MRRAVCRLTTKDYNRLFLELVAKLNAAPSESGRVAEQFLASQTADARLWPSDAQLIDAFVSLPVYSLLTKTRLRMILEAIEDAYRGPRAEDQFVTRGTLTIEHILPRAWHEHWPLVVPAGETEDSASLLRDRGLHAFGSLTLLTKALNPAVSNSAWPLKRDALDEHSVLHLNKRVLEMNVEQWDEAAIEARGRQLAARAIMVWPRLQGN